MINQVRLRAFCSSSKYMFGYQVPKSLKQAKEFDVLVGNHEWENFKNLKHEQLQDYKTLIDQDKFSESNIPKGYKKISVWLFTLKTN